MLVCAFVQVRIGSQRLPGKALMEVDGKSLISHVLDRLKKSKKITQIVLVTPETDADVVFMKYWHEVFKGSEEDLLKRFYDASKAYPADLYVRITGDCPLIDPKVVDQVIDLAIQTKASYASNTLQRTFPRGLDVEVFTSELLEEAYSSTSDPWDREHVTPYMRRKGGENLSWKSNASEYRVCVDTPEDYQVVSALIKKLDSDSGVEEIVKLCKENPELMNINKDVKQKEKPCN